MVLRAPTRLWCEGQDVDGATGGHGSLPTSIPRPSIPSLSADHATMAAVIAADRVSPLAFAARSKRSRRDRRGWAVIVTEGSSGWLGFGMTMIT